MSTVLQAQPPAFEYQPMPTHQYRGVHTYACTGQQGMGSLDFRFRLRDLGQQGLPLLGFDQRETVPGQHLACLTKPVQEVL
jgi:hypothetical protein